MDLQFRTSVHVQRIAGTTTTQKARGIPGLLRRVFFLALLLTHGNLAAQGEALFRAKCATCHLLDRNSTGPALQGARQKWKDAGEQALLYQWVTNSRKLIAGGRSKMALAVKDFSPASMPEQQLQPAEIDQIFDYIDGYVAPPPPPTETDPTPRADYAGNFELFCWLFGLGMFLLLTIVVMSRTMILLLRSDVFSTPAPRQREEGRLLRGTLVVWISYVCLRIAERIGGVRIPATGERPWLLVEAFDLYVLLGLDVFFLFVVLYLRSFFDGLLAGEGRA